MRLSARKEKMDVKDFYYDLPQELIAQDPLADRASSRLMHLGRFTGKVEHCTFKDIKKFLRAGDCLVLNDTKVIPARLIGVRTEALNQDGSVRNVESDAKIEILLLKRVGDNKWETLVKPGKKCKPGTKVTFGDGRLTARIVDVLADGNRVVEFFYKGIWEEVLDSLGEMPLPPYITHKLQDKNRYQTVYAKHEGSAAAPTAGLHFTKELLKEIEDMGVSIAYVTLHVGLGTFRPVKVEKIEEHHMHSEFYVVSEEASQKINDAKNNGGKIICVGTTSMRTLESAASDDGFVPATSGWTDIFIYPGYKFKVADGLLTNFHLPQSTLVMLVSALAGKDNVMNAYKEAIKEKYRFFSFGDAMYIDCRDLF